MFSFVFLLLLLYVLDVMSYSSVPTINSNAYITLVNNKLLAVMHFHFLMKCILLFNTMEPCGFPGISPICKRMPSYL